MNCIKQAVYGLLFVIPVAYSNTTLAGSIVLADKDGSICVFQLPVLPETKVAYDFGAAKYCGGFNDKARTITFREVPSATRVELFDTRGKEENGKYVCSRGNGGSDTFHVVLKTTKNKPPPTI